jgi:tetratricopeptide (TPR) repeat protein
VRLLKPFIALAVAMDAISGSSREDRLDLAVAKNGLGVAYSRMGRYAEAEPLVEEALDLWREILGPSHVNDGRGSETPY